jgi:CelD/BcsL family acetyltransferase involved in cellulose biosynthesis
MNTMPRRHANSAVTDEDIEIRPYCGPEGLERLRPAWEALAARVPGKRHFHLSGWYKSYLKALAPEPQAVWFFLLVRREEPLAVFPLEIVTERIFGIPVRAWRIPVHAHMNLTDFLMLPSPERGRWLRYLVEHLNAQPSPVWDVLCLAHVLEKSNIAEALAQAPLARHITWHLQESYQFSCPNPGHGVGGRASGSFRRNLRRLKRRAETQGSLSFRRIRGLAELEEAFEEFLELEASGWKGANGSGTAIRCHAELIVFYRTLLHEYAARQGCHINLLMLDNRPIAAQFCLLTDNTLSILKIGYHERYAALAPGNLLMEQLLRPGEGGSGLHTVSLVINPAWGRSWRPEVRAVFDHWIFRRTVRGELAYYLATVRHWWRVLRRAPRIEATSQDSPYSESPTDHSHEHPRH